MSRAHPRAHRSRGRGSPATVERDSGSRPRRPGGEPPWLASIREALEQRFDLFDENGCTEAAATCRRDLAIAESESRRWWLEELTRGQAAAELGCSADTIDRRLRDGLLPNAGKRGSPRVRRADLWARIGKELADESVFDRHQETSRVGRRAGGGPAADGRGT